MRTQLNTSPILTHGVSDSQVSMMDMDLDGMKQACQIFRDNIYSNKMLAVVREWTCNAVDEHAKHQLNKAVEIGVKDGRFFVRDFAKGLSDEGIRNVFGKYFRSTKSNSNQPIGGFGVGAKAGHCYNDVFYVTSHFEGKKTIYSCILGGDESGASIGQVVELSHEPTSETGLLVEIEIKPHDTQEFLRYASDMAIFSELSAVKVVNLDGTFEPQRKTLIREEGGIKVYSVPDLKSGYYFTMGGVYYSLPQNCDIHTQFDFLNSVSPILGIQIDVPVGFFDVPISRESFRDTAKFVAGFEKCGQILQSAVNEDASAFVGQALSFYAVTQTNQGTFFKFKNKKFLPSAIAIPLQNIGCVGDESHPIFVVGKKTAVCVLSNSFAHRSTQKLLLEQAAKEKSVQILVMEQQSADVLKFQIETNAFESDLVFGRWQKFFPKPQSSQKNHDGRYSVYIVGRGRREAMSALELSNRAFASNFATHQEVQVFVKNRVANIKNRQQLVDMSVDHFGLEGFKFSAKAMKNALISLGFLEKGGAKYRDILNSIIQMEQLQATKNSEVEKLSRTIQHIVSPKTERIIREIKYSKNYSHKIGRVEKMANMLKGLIENPNAPLLAKVFVHHAQQNFYFKPRRSEIRLAIKELTKA